MGCADVEVRGKKQLATHDPLIAKLPEHVK